MERRASWQRDDRSVNDQSSYLPAVRLKYGVHLSPGHNREFGLGLADAYLAVALLAILVARFVPFSLMDGLAPCTFRIITGIPCPGCGFTRSFVRTANLDFAGAFLVSPLGTLLFLFLVLFVILGLLRLVLRRPWPRIYLSRRASIGVGVITAVVVLSNWGYLLIRHFVIGDWA